MKTTKGKYLSLNRISCDLYLGLKLSESTPLFQRRILLAGNQQEKYVKQNMFELPYLSLSTDISTS